MDEFSDSLGYKIIIGVFVAIFIGLAVLLLTNTSSNLHPEYAIIAVVFLMFPILVIISKIIRKVIISSEGIISIWIFGRKEILAENVKGFRIGDKVISIESL